MLLMFQHGSEGENVKGELKSMSLLGVCAKHDQS